MYKCLPVLENNILNSWDTYRKKERPVFYFINDIFNIVLIHQTIVDYNDKHTSLEESMALVIQMFNLQPFLIERKTRETLALPSNDLIQEIDIFEEWVDSKQVDSKWHTYANLSRNSSVLQYRIGPDWIDVVFSSSKEYYYHYSYKITGILITENLKHLALKGFGLGRNTRKIQKGMFEKKLNK